MMRARAALLLVAGLWLAGAVPARAQGTVPRLVVAAGSEVSILADRLEEIGPDDLLIATGNVEIIRGPARLLADRVEINQATGDAVAEGRVIFYDGEDQLTGRRIDYNLKTGTGVVYQSEARAGPYYRIAGERMERLGESVYRVRRGVFTTCEDDPPSWSFRFGSATADLNEFVYGTNASFWVKNVPLIPFVPFFAAAIRRERQTGFLFPRLGTSSRKGIFAELPFFWAISDSQDATVAPLVFERRGVGLSGEYRYVLSADQRGSLTAFALREIFRDDDDRALGGLKHEWLIAPGLNFRVDVNAVSDDLVLRDYGDRLSQRSSERVESNVFLTRTWTSWNLVGNLFWYQDLTARRPVELYRLPEISLQGVRQPVPGLPGLLWEADASAVSFVRDVGSDGVRLDLHPRLSRPIAPGGVFTLTPFVGGRLTGYDKTVRATRRTRGVDQPIEITEDEARVRTLVEAGADLEMRLSRVYALGGRWGLDSLLHAVEPRVNYTWIAGRNQDRLPIWTEGVDRIPDTSRIEYSLTNRLRARTVGGPDADPVRWEPFRLAFGHSYDVERERAGDITSTLIAEPGRRLRVRADVAHGVHGEGFKSAITDVSASVAPVSASVGTRYSALGNIAFLQGGLTADLSRYFTARATTHYDFRSDTFIENRVALDVRLQCWSLTVELVNRHRGEDEVRFAVNLLGVGGPIQTSVGLGALESAGQR